MRSRSTVPTTTTSGAFLIALAVHVAFFGALMRMSGSDSERARNVGFSGSAPQGSGGGLAMGSSAPPVGPSIPPDRAEPYLGRYRTISPNQPSIALLVTVVNDGVDHWSLMVQEGQLTPYKLVLVAPDSFVHQLNRRYRVVFVRRDSTVTAIELSGHGPARRGDKLLTRER